MNKSGTLDILILSLAVLFSSSAFGERKIEQRRCDQLRDKLGQLLYVNVDGFGDEATKAQGAISAPYIKMVKDLKVGGVLPKPNTADPMKMRESYEKLKEAVELPLLIGVDYAAILLRDHFYSRFGMGFGNGYLGENGKDNPDCLRARSFLDALLHRSVGLNHTLGPTTEHSVRNPFLSRPSVEVAAKAELVINEFKRLGVSPTIKHYPYTPDTFNLHNTSVDTLLSPEEVLRKIEIFGKLAGSADFIMSTHLLNSNIDPDNVVTFSKSWIDILRNDLEFDGILMTDALFMFDKYPASMAKMAAEWPQEEVPVENQHVIFAARAILAGHDMILLEGTSSQTYATFNGLLDVACTNSPLGAELYSRVEESYDRIVRWKSSHTATLRQKPIVPAEIMSKAVKLYTAHGGVELNKKLCLADEMSAVRALELEVEKLNILPMDTESRPEFWNP